MAAPVVVRPDRHHGIGVVSAVGAQELELHHFVIVSTLARLFHKLPQSLHLNTRLVPSQVVFVLRALAGLAQVSRDGFAVVLRFFSSFVLVLIIDLTVLLLLSRCIKWVA
jgi:hypothetical protein